MSRPPIDIPPGTTFRGFTVVSAAPKKAQYYLWNCQCDCGKLKIYETRQLRGLRVPVDCGCGINRPIKYQNVTGEPKTKSIQWWKKNKAETERRSPALFAEHLSDYKNKPKPEHPIKLSDYKTKPISIKRLDYENEPRIQPTKTNEQAVPSDQSPTEATSKHDRVLPRQRPSDGRSAVTLPRRRGRPPKMDQQQSAAVHAAYYDRL